METFGMMETYVEEHYIALYRTAIEALLDSGIGYNEIIPLQCVNWSQVTRLYVPCAKLLSVTLPEMNRYLAKMSEFDWQKLHGDYDSVQEFIKGNPVLEEVDNFCNEVFEGVLHEEFVKRFNPIK